ncbi:MAG: FG-GAP repeat domain-containing protein [Planctomycetota bacterium]|jgi:hypothetical protein
MVRGTQGALPRLAWPLIGLAVFAPGARAQIQLTETAATVGLDADHVAGVSAYTGQQYLVGGLAVGDLNDDGWPDVFATGGSGAPDRLFINDGDGTFTDRAAAWGVADVHAGRGVSVADFDGDGWLDLYVTSWGPGPPALDSHRPR